MKNSSWLLLFLFFVNYNLVYGSEEFTSSERKAAKTFSAFVKCQNQNSFSGLKKMQKLSSCIDTYFNPNLNSISKKRLALILTQSSSIKDPIHCSDERRKMLAAIENKSNEILCTQRLDGQKRQGFISFSHVGEIFYIDNFKF